MPLLLSIESSSHICSIAIHKQGKLLSQRQHTIPQHTAAALAPMIESELKKCGLTTTDFSGIIVSAGPGSYTGLRIGVATAKGLCYALQIPLIAINTLQLLAYQFIKLQNHLPANALLCPMLDARRMEVYCMLLTQQLEVIEPTTAKIIDSTSFTDKFDKFPVYFLGDGAEKCQHIMVHPSAKYYTELLPQASLLGELGYEQFLQNRSENIRTFEPLYLKEFMIKRPSSL